MRLIDKRGNPSSPYPAQIGHDCVRFSRSFTQLHATEIATIIDVDCEKGRYWPDPPIPISINQR